MWHYHIKSITLLLHMLMWHSIGANICCMDAAPSVHTHESLKRTKIIWHSHVGRCPQRCQRLQGPSTFWSDPTKTKLWILYFFQEAGTRSGHHRDTIGTPSGHHRDTIGTRSGHDRDTIGTPSGHDRDTIGTPSGHHWGIP
jgi:hypothetical protein